ncbi:MAG TPA: ATP-binding cassette domain-containing protein [Gemmataceae bacterium]|nr:ATP-binding cassette domain-containing protein [Gemmataceae bacterium]
MIALENLALRAGAFALDSVSFRVETGQYAVLMGKTGSGKTTLLEAVAGLKPVRAGRVLLMGHDVTALKAAERGVGYLPQDLALFPTMTVCEHLEFALRVRRRDRQTIADRVAELAALLGIGHLLDRRPEGLSGGESQRVALGRALSFRPRVLLLDEPLSALDDETRQEMYALLRSVQRQTGVTALHVTHNLSEAKVLADRLFVLRGGTISESLAEV